MKLLPPVVSALAAFCLCWYLSAKRREAEAETSRRKPAAVSALPSPAPAAAPAEMLTSMEQSLEAYVLGEGGPFSGERLREMCAAVRRGDGCAFAPIFLYARRWALVDPAGMYAWFEAQGRFELPADADGGRFTLGFESVIFTAWAEKDPAAAVEMAEKQIPQNGIDGLCTVIGTLLTSDPAKARGLVLKHGETLSERGGGVIHLQDAPGLWELLTSLPASPARNRLTAAWLQRNVEDAQISKEELERLWQAADPELKQGLAAAGFPGQPPSPYWEHEPVAGDGSAAELEGLAEMARAHAEQSGTPEAALRHLMVYGKPWAQRDPAAAVRWAGEHLKGRQRIDQSVALFSAAAKNFPAAAVAWHALPDGQLKARAAGALAVAASPEDKAAATALLDALSPADRKAADAQIADR